jgi:signal transduction histidine kinase
MDATRFTSARSWRAHALKNCITVINAVNKLIERELSQVSRQRMERSQQALGRMLSMLSDDLAHPVAQGAGERRFVPAEDVVHSVLARVEDVADAAGVGLFVRVGTGGVIGDVNGLTEALCNIVLNAVQATPVGGAVFVATYDRPGGSQLWLVQDTGSGMSKEVLAQAGTPRFSRRAGGSGLGLASAIDGFEQHSGVVRIDSQDGSGTLISILLPREAQCSAPVQSVRDSNEVSRSACEGRRLMTSAMRSLPSQ